MFPISRNTPTAFLYYISFITAPKSLSPVNWLADFVFSKFLCQEAHLYIDFLPRFCYSHYKFSTADRFLTDILQAVYKRLCKYKIHTAWTHQASGPEGRNQMGDVKLYRKRVIPEECLLLDKDVILYRDPEVIITKWDTIHPKKTLHHGYSCYFIDRGFKVSKFYDHDGNLISWYCDIICHTYDPETETYVFTDLLADVIVYPDGFVRVVDLDELADAFRDRLITAEQMQMALRRLDKLLSLIYKGAFPKLQKYIEDYEAMDTGD